MTSRIATWVCLGAVLAIFWTRYLSATPSTPVVWALACLSCPIVLARQHGLSLYAVLLANALTYGLMGCFVEVVRRQHRPRVSST